MVFAFFFWLLLVPTAYVQAVQQSFYTELQISKCSNSVAMCSDLQNVLQIPQVNRSKTIDLLFWVVIELETNVTLTQCLQMLG